MRKRTTVLLIALALIIGIQTQAQDTFSIVAVDSITGEVGSAGASCVDLTNYPNYTYHFLGELFPGVGAINTQAYYLAQNQANARARMQEGMSPQEIIDWLIANDHQNNPSVRQYGIVGLDDGTPSAAGYTGSNTDDYKNHVTGNHYSIQGNILLGQQVLEQMEANFLAEEGDLACKLMAALQGANMVGADSRCASNGTSSLFAFLKVAQPDDTFGNPSFVVGLKTEDGAGIEPIDSLQVIFDELHACSGVGMAENLELKDVFQISPNPAHSEIKISSNKNQVYNVQLIDEMGKIVRESTILNDLTLDISDLRSGIYFVRFSNDSHSITQKIIKQK